MKNKLLYLLPVCLAIAGCTTPTAPYHKSSLEKISESIARLVEPDKTKEYTENLYR